MYFLALDCSTSEWDVIANIFGTIINLIQFAVPIILIVLGMLDLGKAVMSSKEDEIKKGQTTFVKRLVAAIVVFLIITIVKIIIGILPDGLIGAEAKTCFDKILGNKK